MTLIAHLSDLHLLEDNPHHRSPAARRRLSFLSFGRPIDADDRRERLHAALKRADRAGADHVVVTGDLTEDGLDPQFEALADVLGWSGIAPERITLVPGNHDAYVDGAAYGRALEGPLRAYRATSTPGTVTRLPGATVLAVSTAIQQHYFRSTGSIDETQLAWMSALALGLSDLEALVFAQHHPPSSRLLPVIDWVDGLRDARPVAALLEGQPRLSILHGHTHRALDRAAMSGRRSQVFSAAAVVDGDEPLRLYRVRGGYLVPALEETARRRLVACPGELRQAG
jgi:3',5'-cyclic-AMP phosphodiesterase